MPGLPVTTVFSILSVTWVIVILEPDVSTLPSQRKSTIPKLMDFSSRWEENLEI